MAVKKAECEQTSLCSPFVENTEMELEVNDMPRCSMKLSPSQHVGG
jgi:hypothetical protein